MFKRKAARVKNSIREMIEEDGQVEKSGEDEDELFDYFLPFVARSPLK